MGVEELQRFIETQAPAACVPVDLLAMARGVSVRAPAARFRPPTAVQLCLVLDAESCLDRLYGGYFSDWVCGGQWNRMIQFLATLMETIQTNNMELAVFFSGALELPRMRDWVAAQYAQRRDINQALKHLSIKATPPPKVWWTAPACLRTALRLALRHLEVQVLCSSEEHTLEVMAFCRENNYHGVMAENAEYIIFNPPRYFSAKQMKLTYKGNLETKEFILHEVARGLDLQPNRFCLLAALLGNHILTEEALSAFHLGLLRQSGKIGKYEPEDVIRLVLEFVRSLPAVDCLETVGAKVFKSASDPRVQKLKDSVEYYVNGSRDGYFKYKSKAAGAAPDGAGSAAFASDSEPADGRAYNETKPAAAAAAASSAGQTVSSLSSQLRQMAVDDGVGVAPGSFNGGPVSNGHLNMVSLPPPPTAGSCPAVSCATPAVSCTTPAVSCTTPAAAEPGRCSQRSGEEGPLVTLTPPPLPTVTPEVLRTAAERHQKGLMSPWVYQVLSKGELKMAVSMEDELGRELPNATLFYRPVRQRVYAVLFNLYHHSFLNHKDKEKPAHERHEVPLVQVREWAYSRNNPYTRPDLVTARPLGWGVPTVQRLWFGTADDDKKRRLRAFLTCMHSDVPSVRSTAYVPQHLLVLACVLRYMMSQSSVTGQSFVYKPELDAFIAQALSPKLTESQYLQELQLAAVTPRGVQLANLFMQGVETALFANDACGAPVPWAMCCPWLFFDGKLFHSYLLKATQCRNVSQLCDGRLEMVAQLEMLREAVMDGLQVPYGRPPLALAALTAAGGGGEPASGPLDRRGGRLEIGGVVVGSWAGSVGRGSGAGAGPPPLMPAGMHRRPPAGRGVQPLLTGYNSTASHTHYSANSGGGGNKKKQQGKRKPGARGDDGPRLPGGRAMTVDTSSTREVGVAAGGAAGDTPGQFSDRPLAFM